MKKFIVNLLSNRFGILLATLNVCYFLSRPYFQHALAHEHGEQCLVMKAMKGIILFPVIHGNIESFMILLNLPSVVFSLFSYSWIKEVSSNLCFFTQVKLQTGFFAFFVVFQWLFIAWIAKTLAAKIRKPQM